MHKMYTYIQNYADAEQASAVIEYVGLGALSAMLIAGVGSALDASWADQIIQAILNKLVVAISGSELFGFVGGVLRFHDMRSVFHTSCGNILAIKIIHDLENAIQPKHTPTSTSLLIQTVDTKEIRSACHEA